MTATRPRGRRNRIKLLLATIMAAVGVTSSLVACTSPNSVSFPNARVFGVNSYIEDNNGGKLGAFAAPGDINYIPVDQSRIVPDPPIRYTSQYIGWAMIDAEDADFYTHDGYQEAALMKRLAQGGGGSTITMQLMTITSLTRPTPGQNISLIDKYKYKDKQQALARKYEAKLINDDHLSKHDAKNQILTEYANVVPYCRQSRGVEAASWSLFGHGISSSKFTLSKAAILAALLKDPCYYTNNATQLQQRRQYVLGQMVAKHHITQPQYQDAMDEPITLLTKWSNPPSIATSSEPYIAQLAPMWLRGQFKGDANNLLAAGDLHFKSTINPHMQSALNSAVQAGVRSSSLVAGVVIIDANTGDIPALYGGNRQRFVQNERNMAVTELRRGGSTSKVFTLATAIADGRSPSDTIDCPGRIYGYTAPAGTYTLTNATKISHNTCFLQLITELGPQNVVAYTKKLLGDNQTLIPGSDGPNLVAVPSFTLGTSEMTAYQRGAAIIPIANREGRIVRAHLFGSVDQGSRTIWKYVAATDQVMDPQVAQTDFDTLTHVADPGGTAAGLGISGRTIMWKTGTDTQAEANSAVAALAADQDSGLICSVVISDPNGGKLTGTTSRNAAKICRQFFLNAL